MDIELRPVSLFKHSRFLYRLLEDRPEYMNISHREMPTFDQHLWFLLWRPYRAHYVIYDRGGMAGTVYLTKNDEIGIHLAKGFQGRGIGKMAIKQLRARHPRKRFLANINPANLRSIRFFEREGFRHIQNTYSCPGENPYIRKEWIKQ